MKAIILAAGQGTRLKKYTKDLPKGMLDFGGKTLIQRQIETYRRCGINDISIVTGFSANKIRYEGIKYYNNANFEHTNMVESLLMARNEFSDDCIISYSDILFEDRLLEGMKEESGSFCVAVDDAWEAYWKLRYGRVDYDTESLKISDENNIVELGKADPAINEIDARYIGLLKFSREGLEYVCYIMKEAYREYYDKPWQQSGKTAPNAYMTDLLNAIIESGRSVKAIRFNHGWIEFDTNEDYENAIKWQRIGDLNDIIEIVP